MGHMINRINDHIEFHEAVDSHKSDVAFLKKVKEHLIELEEKLEEKLDSLESVCDCSCCMQVDNL